MLRLLSIRNFAVVAALEVEFERGFTVLTGETGAGKSLLLDALSLLLGDRFEARQLRLGADRAEIAAEFDLADAPAANAWLIEHDLAEDGSLLLRRVLDAAPRPSGGCSTPMVALRRWRVKWRSPGGRGKTRSSKRNVACRTWRRSRPSATC